MFGHPIVFSVGLSAGFHVLALGGALVLLPDGQDHVYSPVQVTLVELAHREDAAGVEAQTAPAARTAALTRPVPPPRVETVGDAIPVTTAEADDTDDPNNVTHPRMPAHTEVIAVRRENMLQNRALLERVAMPGRGRGDVDVGSVSLAPGEGAPSRTGPAGGIATSVEYLSNAPPRYPRLARRKGWEGTVLLAVEVLPTGRVNTVRVAQSSGYAMLDRAATQAVRKWRFSVSGVQDSGVNTTVEIPVTFALDTL